MKSTAVAAPSAPRVPVLCPGGTVVCMATGPSLTQADVDYVRGKATVIAVQDAWRLAPWADVLYSSDRRWYPYHQWVPGYHGIKVSLELHREGVIALRNTGDEGIEWDSTGLRHVRNSGGASINLAVHLGAQRVILLGFDMRGTHFFGVHPQGLSNNTAKGFQLFQQKIGTMVAPLNERGIAVVNCTPHSALRCFPIADLREVLA